MQALGGLAAPASAPLTGCRALLNQGPRFGWRVWLMVQVALTVGARRNRLNRAGTNELPLMSQRAKQGGGLPNAFSELQVRRRGLRQQEP